MKTLFTLQEMLKRKQPMEDVVNNGIVLTVKEKMKILEGKGWSFTRWSKSKQAWVKYKSMSNRQLVRAIEHAWRQQALEEMVL